MLFARDRLSAVAGRMWHAGWRATPQPHAAIAQAAGGHFWYYVAPQAGSDAWAVMFEGQPRTYGYESQAGALKAACLAAEALHRHHHTAAGVRVRAGQDWREAVKFGAPACPDQQPMDSAPTRT